MAGAALSVVSACRRMGKSDILKSDSVWLTSSSFPEISFFFFTHSTDKHADPDAQQARVPSGERSDRRGGDRHHRKGEIEKMAHSAARSVAGSRTAAGGRCQVVPPRPRAARDTQQGLSLRRVSTPRRAGLVAASGSRRDGAGGFWSGVLVGGTVFGVLGFLFAPQVSRALLNSERMKKLLGDGSENLEVKTRRLRRPHPATITRADRRAT